MTLIDGQTNEEMRGWVVREHRYVYGLADFYRRHRLPVGAYITVRAPMIRRASLSIFRATARIPNGYGWLCPVDKRLTFENHKRAIGAEYDELMSLGADDLKGVDALWMPTDRPTQDLADTMRDMMIELARLTPQRTVHAKTLYSAVNVDSPVSTRPDFCYPGRPARIRARGRPLLASYLNYQ